MWVEMLLPRLGGGALQPFGTGIISKTVFSVTAGFCAPHHVRQCQRCNGKPVTAGAPMVCHLSPFPVILVSLPAPRSLCCPPPRDFAHPPPAELLVVFLVSTQSQPLGRRHLPDTEPKAPLSISSLSSAQLPLCILRGLSPE